MHLIFVMLSYLLAVFLALEVGSDLSVVMFVLSK